MTKTICIYHANCADGFTAAWAVHSALGEGVEFHPGTYGDAPPDVAGADVILVDFSYKRPALVHMAATARSVLVLDHHKTAQEDLAGLPSPSEPLPGERPWTAHLAASDAPDAYSCLPACIFDMERAGAQLAWDFFHPGKKRPALVDYVADRDLYRFDLTFSREIAAWLFSQDYDFGQWHTCALMLDDPRLFKSAAERGAAIEAKHRKDISAMVEMCRRSMVIGNCTVPVANLPRTMASDAAHLMARGEVFAATYFDRGDGQRVFSLRSIEGGMDVSKIAAQYGGGGHKHAAGFQMPIGWEGDHPVRA
ncbi:DHHA1 domain-containing protein [Leisingera daeponensis]|uniref:DHHA1 domain-containing protein n=1 Tax=Leisingera daeponensis TaxID=405746 RepID=UPI001C974032|nr:DHHA1 domain-containing protein [Leisingera daeponensis]MBY6055346.1 phosphohydrolase [Leisingera daeponensis]